MQQQINFLNYIFTFFFSFNILFLKLQFGFMRLSQVKNNSCTTIIKNCKIKLYYRLNTYFICFTYLIQKKKMHKLKVLTSYILIFFRDRRLSIIVLNHFSDIIRLKNWMNDTQSFFLRSELLKFLFQSKFWWKNASFFYFILK